MKDSSSIGSVIVSKSLATSSEQPIEGLGGKVLQIIALMSATRANGRAGLVADTAVSCALLYIGTRRSDAHPVSAVLTIFLGLALFSFVEYCFHRWLFHGSVRMLEQGHSKHHEQPLGFDSLPFFLPPLALLILAGLLALVVPVTYALLLSGSLAAGYAIYGLSHSVMHDVRFRHLLPRAWAASHHIHHHHPDSNFGVTTPVWDFVFGTKYTSKGKGLTGSMQGNP